MRRVIRPILGFGPWGFALAPVALVLVVAAAGGFDARMWLLWRVTDAAGVKAMYAVVTSGLPAYHFASIGAVPGPITLCIVLVAMHISPRRRAWWNWWAVAGVLLACPLLWWRVLGRGIGSLSRYLSGGNSRLAATVIAVLVTAAIVWFVTRRRGVTLWVLGVTGLTAGLDWLIALSPSPEMMPGWVPRAVAEAWPAVATYLVPVLWNGAVLFFMLRWAVRERSEATHARACEHCGYDLRGLGEGGVCPECGATSPSPPAAPSRP